MHRILAFAASAAFALPLMLAPHTAFAQEATSFLGPIIPEACHCEGSAPGWGCVLQVTQNAVNFAISFAIVIITLVLAYAGFLWMLSPFNARNKEMGRSMILGAVVGLLIALSSWLIVDFVMKMLYDESEFGPWNSILEGNEVNLCIQPLSQQGTGGTSSTGGTGSTGGAGSTSGSNAVAAGCSNCGSVPSSLPHKAPGAGCDLNGGQDGVGAVTGLTECMANIDLISKLQVADNLISGSWEVTEMWPPTRNHEATCHMNGTCVDAASRGAGLSEMAAAFVQAGLYPVYESSDVSTREQCEDLYASFEEAGAGAAQILKINATPHFSVYASPRSSGCVGF